MSLAPTARGLRLVRTTRAATIALPPPAGPAALLVTDTSEPIINEAGFNLTTEGNR